VIQQHQVLHQQEYLAIQLIQLEVVQAQVAPNKLVVQMDEYI
jgi:hypothetical protein